VREAETCAKGECGEADELVDSNRAARPAVNVNGLAFEQQRGRVTSDTVPSLTVFSIFVSEGEWMDSVDGLYPGSRFSGTQKSGRSAYPVIVTIQVTAHVNELTSAARRPRKLLPLRLLGDQRADGRVSGLDNVL
jgi:hypothetical protein